MLAEGGRPVLISPASDKIQMFEHLDRGDTKPVDVQVENAKVQDYVGLVLPGGVANPDQLRTNPAAVAFVKSFFDAGQPVAATGTPDKVALGLLVAGFATKAGLVPFHGWLADAHTAAPGPASALFSGLMVSFGSWRSAGWPSECTGLPPRLARPPDPGGSRQACSAALRAGVIRGRPSRPGRAPA